MNKTKRLSTLKESISNRATRNSFGGGHTICPPFFVFTLYSSNALGFPQIPPNVLETAAKKNFIKKFLDL